MKRMNKKMLAVMIVLFCSFFLSSCASTKKEEELVLRIANWEEYIDEGSWDDEEVIEREDGTKIFGENSMIDDFETWYEKTYGQKVRVEYSTFGTNEDLYNQMTLGDSFDLICPSEYMMMKLMKEKKLEPYSEHFFDRLLM